MTFATRLASRGSGRRARRDLGRPRPEESRDREKAVFELYKTVGDAVDALWPVVLKAWSEYDPEARRVAVAETVWRLQQIGGFVERIRRQSSRWAWRGVRSPTALRSGPYPFPDPHAAWRSLKLIRARTSPGLRSILTWTRHILLPFRWTVDIKATSAMARLRDAITTDPFNDPNRLPDDGRHESVELAVGEFLQSLDERLIVWMDAGKED